MKKVKQTPVPLPGSVSRSRQPPFKPLSTETIDSSDDSSNDTPAPKPKTKPAKTKAPVNIAVHRPSTNGVRKQSGVHLPPKPPVPEKTADLDSETESLSSDESDDGNTKSTEVSKEKKDESSDTSSDSSSESSSDESEAKTENPTQQQQHRPTTSHTVDFRAAQPFVPPKGFAPLSTPVDVSTQAINMFQTLTGKQIWHITAPAGISISDVKEVVMEKAQNGEAAFTQKGIDYGFAVEQDEEVARHVLIPRSNGYRAVETKIGRTLHLQEVPRLPRLSSKQADQNLGSEAAASITRSTIKAPRPQVKGLKMRYFHSGFGNQGPGTIGSSDSEAEAPPPAGLGVMNGAPSLKKSEKRKHEQVNGVETSEGPVKKQKKHRTQDEIKQRAEKKARKEKKREKERTKS
ncbi:hypothetical protein K491DRAFT_673889 [Lophiostoma macrostomum CBS 122681]|uniref:Uncharacterized protein n=1 Tax=Lophiostoma macrostomum CBS 122681 TaxID=1314788 RepID=A0A6A6TNG1_9PLEO|nr:hypothetical protein K491DRAFT_673889 [Lophiostoma macrostomum CBS 122681]